MSVNRRGPWSRREKEYIAANAGRMSATQIATALQRNAKAVENYIIEHHSSSFQETAKGAEYNIQSSPVWKDLEKQFSEEELRMFLYHWGRIVSQFRDDVYPTEEMQVIDTIKLEILMNRALAQQQQLVSDISSLRERINIELQHEEPEMANIQNWERQIGILRSAQESINSDYRDMLNRKNTILKEMKATRDARIKVLESSKASFNAWMRQLGENSSLRKKIGLEMEKMRLAAEAEYKRLSEYHEYEDGEVDQPILTPENVLD